MKLAVITGLILGATILSGAGCTGNSWTLVGESTEQGTFKIEGYADSQTCLEKALELTEAGDYYICGSNCVEDPTTSDGVRCDEYCGPGGCASGR